MPSCWGRRWRPSPAPRRSAAGPDARVTLIKAARLIDVAAGRYVDGQAILIENDRIKEVGPAADVQAHAPADAVVIDLGGATVLPGLIDCHAHLLSAMRARRTTGENILVTVAEMSASQRALLGAANAREALEAGITTVRNVGHSGVDGDAALRDAIDEGWVAGPRMQAATRKLTPPGGQAWPCGTRSRARSSTSSSCAVSGPEDGRRAVREALFPGADVIKVVMDVPPRSLAVDEVQAIVAEAHRRGAQVAAHAMTAAGSRRGGGRRGLRRARRRGERRAAGGHGEKGIASVVTAWRGGHGAREVHESLLLNEGEREKEGFIGAWTASNRARAARRTRRRQHRRRLGHVVPLP